MGIANPLDPRTIPGETDTLAQPQRRNNRKTGLLTKNWGENMKVYTQYSSPGVATILKGKRNSLLNRCEIAPRTEGKPGLMGQNFLAGAIKEEPTSRLN